MTNHSVSRHSIISRNLLLMLLPLPLLIQIMLLDLQRRVMVLQLMLDSGFTKSCILEMLSLTLLRSSATASLRTNFSLSVKLSPQFPVL